MTCIIKNLYEPDYSLLKKKYRLLFHDTTCLPVLDMKGNKILLTSEKTDPVLKLASKIYKDKQYIIKTENKEAIIKFLRAHYKEEDLQYSLTYLIDKFPYMSAKCIYDIKKTKYFISSITLLILILFNPHQSILTIGIIMNLLYLLTNSFKTYLYISQIFNSKNEKKSIKDYILNDKDLPIYTVLLPMYRESKVISTLIKNMDNLDYPKDKLDIKIIIEKDDIDTLEYMKNTSLPPYYDIIKVPECSIKTKPKACNYGLIFAKGKYIVIYDADDKPDKMQLKKAVKHFSQNKNLACLQAKLNYYNTNYNLLTKCFSIEYSAHFKYILPAMVKLKIPVPLGGTSNHIRKDILTKIGNWDAYNVTEDADLGIRLAAMGYKTDLLNSTTLEEAPITIWAWIKQRARWFKGFIQTYIVHSINWKQLYNKTGFKGLIMINLFIGLPVLTFIFSLLLWLFPLIQCINYSIYYDPLMKISLYNLILGIIINMIITFHITYQDKIITKKNILNIAYPFYWILHSIAAIKALIQFIRKPFFWDKTKHGN